MHVFDARTAQVVRALCELIVPGSARVDEHPDVIVAGSGAGGGIIASELARAGRDVLLLEAGPRLTARDFTRWEAHANHTIWFPVAFADSEDGGPPIPMIRGRVTGGPSTPNTKDALGMLQ